MIYIPPDAIFPITKERTLCNFLFMPSCFLPLCQEFIKRTVKLINKMGGEDQGSRRKVIIKAETNKIDNDLK